MPFIAADIHYHYINGLNVIDLFDFSRLGSVTTFVFVYLVIIAVPTFAIIARRLHDINKSGLWSLLLCIPVIGWVWLFILLTRKGNEGQNRYGPDQHQYVLTSYYSR